jgi:lipopolysaccharide/colanic/teichoic acid biosynthesis glycosyltransferase
MSVAEDLLGEAAQLAALPPVSRGESTAAAGVYAAAWRLAELVVAGVGLVVLAPLLLVACLAIVLDSRGGPLYRQERVGRAGRRFHLAKLRTMVRDAEPDGHAVWAQARDPRVTRVGAFLRRSRLDEIPQCWNVLRGEMSLIGPRPERPEFEALLAATIPQYRARHAVRPGITGWAQVNYRYASSVEDAATKLEYDLYYVRHRSLRLDAVILLKTLAVVLRFSGI